VALSDTHPAARAHQIALLRAASPARRFGIARSLTLHMAALSRRALRRRNPDASEAELDRLFAEFHYGRAQVRRLMGEP